MLCGGVVVVVMVRGGCDSGNSVEVVVVHKCQEVVILITIYGTFITCFASYSGKS